MICIILLFIHCLMGGFGKEFLPKPEWMVISVLIEMLIEVLIGTIVFCIKDSK